MLQNAAMSVSWPQQADLTQSRLLGARIFFRPQDCLGLLEPALLLAACCCSKDNHTAQTTQGRHRQSVAIGKQRHQEKQTATQTDL